MNAPNSAPIIVGIASKGRPEVVSALLSDLARQTRTPDAVIICSPSTDDLPSVGDQELPFEVDMVVGPSGLTVQRNAILARAPSAAVLVFFDDDFFPESHFLENASAVFAARPDVVVATGCVIADGILGPGFSVEEGRARVAAFEADAVDRPAPEACAEEPGGAYGCNMAVRVAPAHANDVRFDEALPLYGWLEDLDFSRRLMRHGASVRCPGLAGVHLGIKVGRQSGVRLGYSQVVNPLHIMRNGSISARHAYGMIARNMMANVGKLVLFERYIDRFGRLRGNAMAWWDMVRGRAHPQRILEF